MKKLIFYAMAVLLFLGTYYMLHNNFYQSGVSLDRNVDKHSSLVLSDEERHEISINLANVLWSKLSQYKPFYDFDVVMDNFNSLESGKQKPLNDHEYQQQILSLLDKISNYHAQQNLKAAEAYLAEVANRKNVVEVIPQKVYFEILHSGSSIKIVSDDTFKVHLTESRLSDGEIVVMQDTRISNKPITLDLSDTIIGFAKGASGMTLEERRKIYIHPELAYGKYGRHGFQQLMICDVERL